MSTVEVRKALETALATVTPAIDTANENSKYTPIAERPYQSVNLLLADPFNPLVGPDGFHIEQGIFQVTLKYPINVGTGETNTRAELIRSKFPKGSQFTSGGVTVTVDQTPTIAPGAVDGDRWAVPVKIRFYANI